MSKPPWCERCDGPKSLCECPTADEMLAGLEAMICRFGQVQLEEHGENNIGLYIERTRGGGYGGSLAEAITNAMEKQSAADAGEETNDEGN